VLNNKLKKSTEKIPLKKKPKCQLTKDFPKKHKKISILIFIYFADGYLKEKRKATRIKLNNIKDSSVADLHHSDPDPDPSLHFDADPDPATQINVRNTE
jgi:hypothetical protein